MEGDRDHIVRKRNDYPDYAGSVVKWLNDLSAETGITDWQSKEGQAFLDFIMRGQAHLGDDMSDSVFDPYDISPTLSKRSRAHHLWTHAN